MDAAIILLCGIPGAGKTTIARQIAALYAEDTVSEAPPGFAQRVVVHRVSFDELYEQTEATATAFDPIRWKQVQNAMEQLVRKLLATLLTSSSNVCRVLLVDDNFYYRSMRKRFFHIAQAEQKCGFGIIHVATAEGVSRRRNAAREGAARVPDEQFERMIQVFEPPDSSFSFERNVAVLDSHTEGSCGASSSYMVRPSSTNEEALSAVLQKAARELEARHLAQQAHDAQLCQQIQDQTQTAENVVHNFDLASRRWVSSVLNGQDDAFIVASKEQKALLASTLNQRRRALLQSLKAKNTSSTKYISCSDGDPSQLLEHFRSEMIKKFSTA